MYRFKEIENIKDNNGLEISNKEIEASKYITPLFKDIVETKFGYVILFTDGSNKYIMVKNIRRHYMKSFIPIKELKEIDDVKDLELNFEIVYNSNSVKVKEFDKLNHTITKLCKSLEYNGSDYIKSYCNIILKEYDNKFNIFKLSSKTKDRKDSKEIDNIISIDKNLVSKKDLKLIVDIINHFISNDNKYIRKNNSYIINIMKLLIKSFELKYSKVQKFNTSYIPKTDGTMREINAPIDDIRDILNKQSNTLNAILEFRIKKYNIDENIIAYRKNKSIINNAEYHKDNKTIIKFDISKFFDNCHFDYWKENIFFTISDSNSIMQRFEKEMKGFLFRKDNKGLYMGSPLSPAASNLIMVPVMKYIKNVINKFKTDIKVSIYADDITFSSKEINDEFNPKRLKNLVNHAFKEYDLDFKLKEEKSLIMKNHKRKITGLSVNRENDVTISQRQYRKLRTILHLLSNGMEFKEIKEFNNEIELTALINYYLDVDETNKVNRLLNKYEKTYNELKIKAKEV